MNNVSFGSLPRISSTLKIKNSTSRQLAQTINDAFSRASRELGESIKPGRRITSKSIKNINPDSFNRHTGRITEQGAQGFEVLNADIGVKADSTVKDFGRKLQKYITEVFRKNGSVDRRFDYFAK